MIFFPEYIVVQWKSYPLREIYWLLVSSIWSYANLIAHEDLIHYFELHTVPVFISSQNLTYLKKTSQVLLFQKLWLPHPNSLCIKKWQSDLSYIKSLFLDHEKKVFKIPDVDNGDGVFLVDAENIVEKITLCSSDTFILQDYVAWSEWIDIRVISIDGQIVCTYMRQNSTGDFRSNVCKWWKKKLFDIKTLWQPIYDKICYAVTSIHEATNIHYFALDFMLPYGTDISISEFNLLWSYYDREDRYNTSITLQLLKSLKFI